MILSASKNDLKLESLSKVKISIPFLYTCNGLIVYVLIILFK